MVLAQKQKYRSMEQDRKPRDKPTHIMVTLSLIKEASICSGEKTASSISGAEKTGQVHEKDEIRTPSNTIHKNKLKMD